MVAPGFFILCKAADGITPVYTLYCTGVLPTCTSVYTSLDTPNATH
jgi:hypothetical protein